jgi:hypothetical protein
MKKAPNLRFRRSHFLLVGDTGLNQYEGLLQKLGVDPKARP